MPKDFNFPTPTLEDIPTLSMFLVNKAKSEMNLVTLGFRDSGVVVVAPGETPESVESQILEALAS